MIRGPTWSAPLPRALTVGCSIALASAGVLAAREVAMGREELAAADADAAGGRWADAIAHARAAAEALAPGSPWPDRAARRLDVLGHQAELRGDGDTALLAYGALRAAALSTRAIGVSRASWRDAAEEGVARIAGRLETTQTRDAHGRAPSVRDTLRREESPSVWRLAVVNGAALAMVGGLSGLALGGPGRKWIRAATALAIGGLLLYAVVLLMS